ncbi:hypothetical protein C8R45DRAFT_941007 [Mycena sanguinolenta]|nr:hypothetical protein C8R45DRAFT_941007 [Mycena sanguinolenta]
MNIVVAKIKPQARLSDAIKQTGLCSTSITPSGLRVGTLKISSLGYRPAFGSSMEQPWSIHRAQRCTRQGLKVTQWGHSNQLDRALVTSNTRKPVSRLSEQMGLPSRQTGLQADLPGLGFDLQPNPSPSPNKPVGAGASPFGKPKTSLSIRESDNTFLFFQSRSVREIRSTAEKAERGGVQLAGVQCHAARTQAWISVDSERSSLPCERESDAVQVIRQMWNEQAQEDAKPDITDVEEAKETGVCGRGEDMAYVKGEVGAARQGEGRREVID